MKYSPAKEDASYHCVLADPEENNARYVLRLNFPGHRVVTMASGVLRLRNSTLGSALPSASPSPAASRPTSAKSYAGDWKWQVEWKAQRVFLSKAFVADLVSYLSGGGVVTATVHRAVR